MTSTTSIGKIASLWRYPVKSMQGEEIRTSAIDSHGLLGDRAFALIDAETQKVASAKNPQKWPKMFDFYARYLGKMDSSTPLPPIQINLPNGSTISNDDPEIDATLSHALGRTVSLETKVPTNPNLEEFWPDIAELENRNTVTDEDMPQGTFFDLAIIHILTTSTLAKLSNLYPKGRMEVRRFRPNIVIDSKSTEPDFVENSWVGKKIAIGDDVVLKITEPCPRCVMTTLAQGDLPKDTDILRTAVQHNNAHVGVYAEVLQGGHVHCDNEIQVFD